jgi:multicomponent Na+:H+ antiporter subunit A
VFVLLLSVATVVVASLLSVPLERWVSRAAGWILAVPLVAAAGFLAAAGSPVSVWVPWMPTLGVGIGLRLDGLAMLFALLVVLVGAAVLVYSARYLGSGRSGSFYLLMTAFAVSMLVLVLADDLVVLFVAWEATTLCSFFLIARSGPRAREPAIRTLLVTVAGGLSLLTAVVLMIVATGTTQLSAVLADPMWTREPGMTSVIAVLLIVAAFTKSAQFPFQAWLPDSMVAISPVSAYLHAAAMVKAGVYLVLRFSPAFETVAVWSVLLVAGGLFTAVFGAAAALRRSDLKELLAYSTMSQLGLLMALVGIGTEAALTAAVIHTLAHALFKSALFMLVGIIDHQAGTRDLRSLAGTRLRMPVTAAATAVAAASMAGVPLLFGFVSKESMFTAFVDAPGPGWVPVVVTTGAAITSVLTFAYSGRLALGALGGRTGRIVPEAPALLWAAPVVCAAMGVVFGVAPFVLDPLVSSATAAAAAQAAEVHLVLWHGVTVALLVSGLVLGTGTALVLWRRRVETVTARMAVPWSGLDVVDALRAGTIRAGARVAEWAANASPTRYLAVPTAGLVVLAVVGVGGIGTLPPIVGDPSRPLDWMLLALVAVGVVATVRARTRIAAVVVVGIVGFAMTLWFFVLGAADVALTQLLVEILTVAVMVLLLHRLPSRFAPDSTGRRTPAVVLAVAAGIATTFGVWALTGRRDISPAAQYFLREGPETTGGANIVNTILVDFRALDTLGELTVLGVAGLSVAALLSSRRLAPSRPVRLNEATPLSDARTNSVFVRTTVRMLGPIVVVISLVLLIRGHQEPGGGFIAALVGGAGCALLYFAAPSDAEVRIRWPYLVFIGAGVAIGVGTGLVGYLDGSFLTPLHTELFGISLTTALIFDVGVYFAVIGVVLAAFNLLGSPDRPPPEPDPTPGEHPEPVEDTRRADTVEVNAR